jgi:imidazolonepropionase-like amidohydrolase
MTPADDDGGSTLLTGARLITGDGATVIDDGALRIRDGLIAALGGGLEPEPGERVVDLAGKTVLPTILNMHGHIGYLRGTTTDKANYSRENVLDHLRRLAYYGVSVFQSLGTDRDDTEIRLRDAQRAGEVADSALAALFTASTGIAAPTPGSDNGGAYFATDVLLEADTPEQARAHVRTVAAKAPDAIKFWVDDRNGTKAKLAIDVYAAIIDEAHAHGLTAIGHIFTLEDAKGVVGAGADGIAHMVRAPGPDAELLDMLTARGVFAFTSMSVQKFIRDGSGWLDDPALAETVGPEVRAHWKAIIDGVPPDAAAAARATYDVLEEGLRRYVEAGVTVVLSGDTGLVSQFPGFTEHRELEAMVRAGMPALRAIEAATRIPADLLGLPDRGLLAVGRRADLLVLDRNPLDDIANSRAIADVYLAGEALDRPAMRAQFLS